MEKGSASSLHNFLLLTKAGQRCETNVSQLYFYFCNISFQRYLYCYTQMHFWAYSWYHVTIFWGIIALQTKDLAFACVCWRRVPWRRRQCFVITQTKVRLERCASGRRQCPSPYYAKMMNAFPMLQAVDYPHRIKLLKAKPEELYKCIYTPLT